MTGAFFHGMSEENMHRVLSQPYVMIGSDASIRAPSGPLSHDYPHPRAYGTFPKLLRMALDGGCVELPELIRRMTSLPAEHSFGNMNLTDNIVRYESGRYSDNPLVVQGPGAGPQVTAAGVFADLLRIRPHV